VTFMITVIVAELCSTVPGRTAGCVTNRSILG